MESVVSGGRLASFYGGRSVLVTGHTGFKGGWLAVWLKALGARVSGFALPPEEGRPSFHEMARVDEGMRSTLGDLREEGAVQAAFHEAAPEIVFHLAAQSLVRRSYDRPVETWATNVLGTAHVLEAVRRTPSVRTVVVVTSDKCYENREWAYSYRENDSLGGHDPYSSSKGAQEIVTSAWRRSFLASGKDGSSVAVATARAGNVIGGGDWAEDRLVPDCVMALQSGTEIQVRSPEAIRPWQHVLEPLSGYLWLALALAEEGEDLAGAWNFGPDTGGNATVREVVDLVVSAWGAGGWTDASGKQAAAPHEATFLRLDCTKAANRLRWRPVLTLEQAVRNTVAWYRKAQEERSFDAASFTRGQIEGYAGTAREAGREWAAP